MRTAASLLVAFVLGGLVTWLFLGRSPAPETFLPTPEPAREEVPAYLRLRTGALEIRVRTPEGAVPPDAEVGYEILGTRHLFYAGPDGSRTLTDVPLGDVLVIGRAPGHHEVQTPRTLLAGIAEEVLLVLPPRAP